jgi:hypothetical protein
VYKKWDVTETSLFKETTFANFYVSKTNFFEDFWTNAELSTNQSKISIKKLKGWCFKLIIILFSWCRQESRLEKVRKFPSGSFKKGKPPLQSRIHSECFKIFPAKIPFSKIQKKNLAGKNLLCKGTRSLKNYRKPNRNLL